VALVGVLTNGRQMLAKEIAPKWVKTRPAEARTGWVEHAITCRVRWRSPVSCSVFAYFAVPSAVFRFTTFAPKGTPRNFALHSERTRCNPDDNPMITRSRSGYHRVIIGAASGLARKTAERCGAGTARHRRAVGRDASPQNRQFKPRNHTEPHGNQAATPDEQVTF
jgi:hypothetical protein